MFNYVYVRYAYFINNHVLYVYGPYVYILNGYVHQCLCSICLCSICLCCICLSAVCLCFVGLFSIFLCSMCLCSLCLCPGKPVLSTQPVPPKYSSREDKQSLVEKIQCSQVVFFFVKSPFKGFQLS